MKLRENKNLVWSSDAQQDYYFGMDKDELINEIESMGEVEDFLRIRGYDDIEEADEDELRSFLLPDDIDLDYEDFTESIMPMIKEQCANDTLVLWGKAANWRGAYDAGAVIDVDDFVNYIYPDYDAISRIYSDNGNLYYVQYSHDTPTGGDTMYLYSFKSDELYDNACRICDSKDDNGDVEWLGEFKDDAGYAETAKAIELGYLTPVTNKFNEGLEESVNQNDLMNAVQDAYGYNKKEAKKYIDSIDDKTKAELIKGFKDNAKRNFLTDSIDYESLRKTESLNEGRYSDYADDETRANGWWYFTTHGVGPGSIPKDLKVLEVREGQNKKGTWGDYVRLDGILNTDELDYYDMIELAPVEEEEDFTGFFSDYDFEESLDEEKTPYGDTTIDDYVETNFDGDTENKSRLIADMKKKANGKDYFNGLDMSVKDWEKAGKQFGLSMKKNPVTEGVKDGYSSSDLQRAIESALSRYGFDYEHGYSLDFISDERGGLPHLEVEFPEGISWKDYKLISKIFSSGSAHWFNEKPIYVSPGKEHIDGGLLSVLFSPKYYELDEDTVKTKSGKWVNKGDTGETHGEFKTKKEADAQRRAMFASGFKG